MTEMTLQAPPARARGKDGPLLDIRGLRVDFPDVEGSPAIDGMDLTVGRGEIVALVGESGSGKSLTALTVMGLLPPGAEVVGGAVMLEDEDLLSVSPKRRNEIRGNKVAMLFQQPKVMLDPTARVGGQVTESLRQHRKVGRREAKTRAEQLLRDVGIPEPKRRASSFAYQLSGGMAQRVMIAAALSADPELVIADEPTTALDVTVQAQILQLLKQKRDDRGLSILLITHDLGIVSAMADRVAVMYAGRIVEDGPVDDVYASPRHPYTRGLLASLPVLGERRPSLAGIPGLPPDPVALPPGCAFHPRCPVRADDRCAAEVPPLRPVGTNGHRVATFYDVDGDSDT
jgi:peptide/nickel transport system ATP-binding protein